MRRALYGSLAATSLLLAAPSPSLAWDSICRVYDDPHQPVGWLGTGGSYCDGASESAQNRWRDHDDPQLDEHRRFCAHAIQLAGLPRDVRETVTLRVFARDAEGTGGYDSVDPVRPLHAATVRERSFSVDEFCQLPDFSYGLWDWAMGHEGECPIEQLRGQTGIDEDGDPFTLDSADQCHTYASHVSALNASHFGPGAAHYYRTYHAMAMRRAAECRERRLTAWQAPVDATDERAARRERQYRELILGDYFRECEVEALALEATAQHYLQDIWSSGHMWNAWGSPSFADTVDIDFGAGHGSAGDVWSALPATFRRLVLADMVGYRRAVVHGSSVGATTGAIGDAVADSPYLFADPACGPHPMVRFGTRDGAQGYAVGDVFAARVLRPGRSFPYAPGAGPAEYRYPVDGNHDWDDWTMWDDVSPAGDRLDEYYDWLDGSSLTSSAETGQLLMLERRLTGVVREEVASYSLAEQASRLQRCSGWSFRHVFGELAVDAGELSSAAPEYLEFGEPMLGELDATTLEAIDPTSDDCLSPTLTNAAFAAAIDGPYSAAEDLDWIKTAFEGPVDEYAEIPEHISDLARMQFMRARMLVQGALVAGEVSASGTELARWEYGPLVPARQMLGMRPVSEYLDASLWERTPLSEPPLPWTIEDEPPPTAPCPRGDAECEQGRRVEALALLFRASHAEEWCRTTTIADLRDLRLRVSTADDDHRAAAQQACIEVAARHMRMHGRPSECEELGVPSVVFDWEGTGSRRWDAERFCESNAAITYYELGYCPPASGGGTICGVPQGQALAVATDSGVYVVSYDAEPMPGAFQVHVGPIAVGGVPTAIVPSAGRRAYVAVGGTIAGLQFPTDAGAPVERLDLDAVGAGTDVSLGGTVRGLDVVTLRGHEWLLAAAGPTDTLISIDLGTTEEPTFELCATVDVGRTAASEDARDVVAVDAHGVAIVSFDGGRATPSDTLAIVDLTQLTRCDGEAVDVAHVHRFGAGVALGAMALSSDGERLAVAARRRSSCLDRVRIDASGTSEEVQVPCDDVFVLRVASLAGLPPGTDSELSALPAGTQLAFGARSTLPTRPGSAPVAVAFAPRGSRLAYASMTGLDDWPRYRELGAHSTVAIADSSAVIGTVATRARHWSYNAAMRGHLSGESIAYTPEGTAIVIGTHEGLFAVPAGDAFWADRNGDPELTLHLAGGLFGSWYGGCRSSSTACAGGVCPEVCPTGADGLVAETTLGSPIRAITWL